MPSVFRLSCGRKTNRPRNLAGNPGRSRLSRARGSGGRTPRSAALSGGSELGGSADVACDCRSRYDLRACQIALRITRSHSALEVAISRGDSDFAGFQQPRAEADARSAAGGKRLRAGIEQRLPDSASFRFLLNRAAGCCQVELHAVSDLLSPQYLAQPLRGLRVASSRRRPDMPSESRLFSSRRQRPIAWSARCPGRRREALPWRDRARSDRRMWRRDQAKEDWLRHSASFSSGMRVMPCARNSRSRASR